MIEKTTINECFETILARNPCARRLKNWGNTPRYPHFMVSKFQPDRKRFDQVFELVFGNNYFLLVIYKIQSNFWPPKNLEKYKNSFFLKKDSKYKIPPKYAQATRFIPSPWVFGDLGSATCNDYFLTHCTESVVNGSEQIRLIF